MHLSSSINKKIQLSCMFEKGATMYAKDKGVDKEKMDSPNQEAMGIFNRIYRTTRHLRIMTVYHTIATLFGDLQLILPIGSSF